MNTEYILSNTRTCFPLLFTTFGDVSVPLILNFTLPRTTLSGPKRLAKCREFRAIINYSSCQESHDPSPFTAISPPLSREISLKFNPNGIHCQFINYVCVIQFGREYIPSSILQWQRFSDFAYIWFSSCTQTSSCPLSPCYCICPDLGLLFRTLHFYFRLGGSSGLYMGLMTVGLRAW